jgi:ribosomal protein L37AE/L43A
MMAECVKCSETFAAKRAALGYKTCLKCGDGAAKAARSGWTVAPVHKSNYVLITNREELSGINNKTVR